MTDVVLEIRAEIAAIQPFDAIEQEHIINALLWVDSGVNIFRLQKPDKPPKHLVTYFVVVDPEHRSILLGDHITAQLWLPSGGHVEHGEHPVQTVAREIQEELHTHAVFLRNNNRAFFITQNVTVGLTAGHTDITLWYLVRGNVHDQLTFDRREYADMSWFTFDEILQSHPAIFDANMHRFTIKLMKYLSRL